MNDPEIRRARVEDVPQLAALKLALFRETFLTGGFDIPYPADDLAAFEQASYSAEAVRAEILDPDHATWVAVAKELVGYAHVGPAKLPHDEVMAGAAELYQLYVARSQQGSGVGRRLLTVAMDHLAETRPGPVWLGVWSGNLKAQEVYRRRGFRKVGGYRFPVGAWYDDEFIFRRD